MHARTGGWACVPLVPERYTILRSFKWAPEHEITFLSNTAVAILITFR
jgi:hypothetical protein